MRHNPGQGSDQNDTTKDIHLILNKDDEVIFETNPGEAAPVILAINRRDKLVSIAVQIDINLIEC